MPLGNILQIDLGNVWIIYSRCTVQHPLKPLDQEKEYISLNQTALQLIAP